MVPVLEEHKSTFLEMVGDTPFFRVLDFLIENRGLDYSKTEIAKGSQVGWSTLHQLWPRLEKNNIVRQTRSFGNARLYTLNTESELVKYLIKIDNLLIKKSWNEFEKLEKIKA